ncbi:MULTISPECIES: copper homeostasis protein CutC [Sphingobacterium]|uniref:PF03932 family protein CutC n=1 Tax=Sphingobacterium populi TaxID=1812824 RepID=A0ABW5UDJ9_9SPHI|nr:copper homeostasis protein CutC [Sphingobacterium sp. CFCC 11742]
MGTQNKIGNYILEICSSSPTSAIAAQRGGASRVELCQSLESGGITPSPTQIRLTRAQLSIGIFVLIRPRSGNFVYSDVEVQEMIGDIEFCKEVGCDGVVVGILDRDGKVDMPRMTKLVQVARPMQVVFHRAFDLCAEPRKALESIIELGCDRILTSGQQETALEGKALLRELISQAAGRIEIMPGAGVDEHNIVEILKYTNAYSIHSSAKIVEKSSVQHLNTSIQSMNENMIFTSQERTAKLVQQLQLLTKR